MVAGDACRKTTSRAWSTVSRSWRDLDLGRTFPSVVNAPRAPCIKPIKDLNAVQGSHGTTPRRFGMSVIDTEFWPEAGAVAPLAASGKSSGGATIAGRFAARRRRPRGGDQRRRGMRARRLGNTWNERGGYAHASLSAAVNRRSSFAYSVRAASRMWCICTGRPASAARNAAFNAILRMLPPAMRRRASRSASNPSVGAARGNTRRQIAARCGMSGNGNDCGTLTLSYWRGSRLPVDQAENRTQPSCRSSA